MRLAICDDNDLERNLLYTLLQKYFSENSVRCEFTLYDRGATLYYDVMEGIEYDIIFLDLFIGDSFGINLAQKLRDLSYHGKIVFCTVSADYALESYQVYASGYILKPYSLQDIRRTLDRFLPEYLCDCYLVKQKARIVYIPLNEILYVESDNTKCVLHRTEDREYNIYTGTLLGEKVSVCSTGIGISIAANKVPGIRCAHCHDTYCAKYTRYHNDANMLAFGEK